MRILLPWLAASLTTLALDLLWLGVLAKSLYARHLGHLMAEKVGWPAAFAFYALYGGGVLYFASGSTLRETLTRGALLGLLVYGTYDLTNMAVLRGWSWRISAADVAWGVFLTACASLAAHKAGRLIA